MLDELMDGDAVIMRCWRDTSTPPGYQTPRWFYVSEGSASPHPGWAGWVHAELVPDQAEVPLCDQQVLDAYPLPPVEPLSFAITGKCTTAGGQLTATSSGFSPGGRYTTSTGFSPSGWMYDEHEGTVDQHGSVPWVLPCGGGQDVDIELGSVITDVTTDRRVYISFVIPAGRQAPLTPTSRPAAAPSSISDPPRSSAPGSPADRVLTVFDKVTNGATQVREDTPAYLSTITRNRCRQDGCMLAGTEVSTGARLSAECQVQGTRTTNGEDRSAVDDGNPQLAQSTLWYGIRWPDGRFGYISEVWISPAERGGLGLPQC